MGIPLLSRSAVHLLLLGLLTLALRFPWLLLSDGPGTLDAAYSYVIGLRLAAGLGWSEPFIWHWLRPPATLVHPSHDYWMPLGAILVAVGTRLGGAHWWAAVLPFLLLSTLLPLLAAWLAGQWGGRPLERWLAGLVAALAGPYAATWATTDPMAAFAVVGALCLAASDNRGVRAATLAGALAGLAQLARADGALLLGVALGLSFGRRQWVAAAGAAGAFLVVVGPWALRNLLTFGQLVPVGLAPLWLTEYNDLFRPGGATPTEWWSRGLGVLVGERLLALGVVGAMLLLLGHGFLTPFGLVGLVRRWRQYPAAGCYLVLLSLTLALVFPYPTLRGSFAHSVGALIPAFAAAAALEVTAAARALARWRGLVAAQAERRVGAIMVVGCLVASLGLGWQLSAEWRRWRVELGAALAGASQEEPGAVLAVADPATAVALGSGPAVMLPNLPPSEAIAWLQRYGVRLILVGEAAPASWQRWRAGAEQPAGVEEVGTVEGFRLFRLTGTDGSAAVRESFQLQPHAGSRTGRPELFEEGEAFVQPAEALVAALEPADR